MALRELPEDAIWQQGACISSCSVCSSRPLGRDRIHWRKLVSSLLKTLTRTGWTVHCVSQCPGASLCWETGPWWSSWAGFSLSPGLWAVSSATASDPL